MTPWNLDDTRTMVHRYFGAQQAELLRPTLNSLHDRQFFAGYHFHEYKRLLAEAIDSRLGEVHVLQLMLPLNEESFGAYFTMQKRVAAHVLACVQSLHALGDTLAYAVALACGLNLSPHCVPERKISLRLVADKLQQTPGLASVGDVLGNIASNNLFTHLAAISNHSKHRGVIEPRIHVDATGSDDRPYRLRFSELVYEGVCYSAIDIEMLLEPLYSFLSNRIVNCGNELNRQLLLAKP